MKQNDVQAIIFDFFGVMRPDNLLMAYRKFGGDPDKDAKFIHDTIAASSRGLIPSSAKVFAEHLSIDEAAWREAVIDSRGNDQELLAYVRELRKHYKVGVLSNIGKGRVHELFSPEEQKMFDAIVTSGDVGYAKPEAQAYEIAADRLGVRLEECIFTDDREEYIEGARAVGMQAILYQNFAQFRRELEKLLP
jgi:HAD superfamily hydrolase (TIGR01509 family)